MRKTLLQFIMRKIARAIIARKKPIIIAITGNVGKTTTKEAVYSVLRSKFSVRATGGNLNNELGVPLTIIGDFAESYYRTTSQSWFWFRVVWMGLGALVRDDNYPDVLVLEYGADRPGDIERLVSAYPPHIAVVTRVGEIPVHVEYFASVRHLANEKAKLISRLLPTGVAVLSYDDPVVLEMRSHTQGRVVTFGSGEGSDVRLANLRPRLDGVRPMGTSFDITTHQHSMPVMISGVLGVGIAKAGAAAVAVALAMDMTLAEATEALSQMTAPAGRMRILDGIRGTTIIDDTYNASPVAMQSAIDTVRAIPASRHVFILGDMRELGVHSAHAHQTIGRLVADYAGVLVCVGTQGALIADAAAASMPHEHIHRASDSREAANLVQQLLRTGDLVLVKGSQGVRMEFIVQEVMARPEQSSRLLVRQSASWLQK